MDTNSAPAVPLTEPQRRALAALIALADEPVGTAQRPLGWATPREVARVLWPDSPGWSKRSNRGSTDAGGAMGATMPMKAATLLHRLRAHGLTHLRAHSNAWSPTEKGRRVISGDPS